MANCIIGSIIAIGATQNLVSKDGNSFAKRSLILSVRRYDQNTGEPINDYENTPEFSFIGDRCRDLDQFQVGQNVCVYFDLVGRRYTPQGGEEKIINDIRPYKIELYGRCAPQQPAPVQPVSNPVNNAAVVAAATTYAGPTPSVASPQAPFNPPI